jgi:plasmid stabilization system protein ParE
MPGTWADAEGAFAPLAGQPLTREQFCVHGGAAYPFILNRPRWDRALPDSRAAASDIKRVALNLAFGEILDGYAFAEILMGDTRTFAEVLDHYAPARHSFEDFGHLVNWLHVVAKNRVRTVMRTLEQSQPAESRASEQALLVEVPRRGDNPLSRRRLRDVRLDGLWVRHRPRTLSSPLYRLLSEDWVPSGSRSVGNDGGSDASSSTARS